MNLRDLYAQEFGFKDFKSMKDNYDNLPDTMSKSIQGMIHISMQNLIYAIEKWEQPK